MPEHSIESTLSRHLRPERGAAFRRRSEGLRRELRWMASARKPIISRAAVAGWTVPRLEIVCAAAAFEQVILGPVRAAARPAPGLVYDIPVLAGTLRLDAATANRFATMVDAFDEIVRQFGFGRRTPFVLLAPTASDLAYQVVKASHA